jgi:hypothetical protein
MMPFLELLDLLACANFGAKYLLIEQSLNIYSCLAVGNVIA